MTCTLFAAAVAGPQCLAADGTPLDWWVALKLPDSDDLAYLDSATAARLQSDARFMCGLSPPSHSNKHLHVCHRLHLTLA
jgi:hypothetical protein